jgi:hypothetical protein
MLSAGCNHENEPGLTDAGLGLSVCLMKRLLYVSAIILLLGTAMAQDLPENLALIRFRVTDQAGAPVPQARVALSTFSNWVPGRKDVGRDEYNTVVGSTDTNGLVELKLKGASGRYGYLVLPLAGFAFDRGTEYVFTNAASGRWEPWSLLVPIVLKRHSAQAANSSDAAGNPVEKTPAVSKDPQVGRQDLFPP